MKHIYSFEHIEEYKKYESIVGRFAIRLKEYRDLLKKDYQLTESPRAVIWTNENLATTVFSDIPIPAFTNRSLIYFSPDLESWRELFIRQLDGHQLPSVEKFYQSYSENHLFIILAHELTHHSDLFVEDFDDERSSGIWFEEGMCFYIPRKLLLSEKEFEDITGIEESLVEAFKEQYGDHSIENFGEGSYEGELSSIMFDYWRSYLAVKYLVEVKANNDIKAVFEQYHQWNEEGRKEPLSQYFGIETGGIL